MKRDFVEAIQEMDKRIRKVSKVTMNQIKFLLNYGARNKKLLPLVRFEVFTAVAKKNGVFWDVTLCGSCKNRRFEGT
jgi:hypothetical protein